MDTASSPPVHRSLNSHLPVNVILRNQTPYTIDTFWHDYTGAKVRYLKLKPGQSSNQPTYATHPWTFVASHPETDEPLPDQVLVVGQQRVSVFGFGERVPWAMCLLTHAHSQLATSTPCCTLAFPPVLVYLYACVQT